MTTRNETIELLNEHLYQQGRRKVAKNTKLTTAQLRARLEKIEDVAMSFCDMP